MSREKSSNVQARAAAARMSCDCLTRHRHSLPQQSKRAWRQQQAAHPPYDSTAASPKAASRLRLSCCPLNQRHRAPPPLRVLLDAGWLSAAARSAASLLGPPLACGCGLPLPPLLLLLPGVGTEAAEASTSVRRWQHGQERLGRERRTVAAGCKHTADPATAGMAVCCCAGKGKVRAVTRTISHRQLQLFNCESPMQAIQERKRPTQQRKRRLNKLLELHQRCLSIASRCHAAI
jgi:hypothetical protein